MNKGIRYVRTVMLLVLMLVLGAAFSGGKAEAASNYMIKVNKQQNVVTVYKMKGGKYKAYKAFVCSAGYATPTGTFRLGEKMRWHTLDGPSYGQYCSRIVNGILFHSVWYYQPNQTTQSYVQYNRLGKNPALLVNQKPSKSAATPAGIQRIQVHPTHIKRKNLPLLLIKIPMCPTEASLMSKKV